MYIDNSQNILFVVNPVAGRGAAEDIEEIISDCLTRHGACSYKIYKTTGKNDAHEISSLINQIKPGKVVAVGGDGTIKLVAEQVVNKKIALGIVPAGSANGMAAELGIDIDVHSCIDTVLNGRVVKVDLIRIKGEGLCLHLSDIGMNAQIVKHYQENNWRGKLGYLKGAVKMLFNNRQMQLVITTDKEELVRTAYMVVLANASKYGTNAVINPGSSIFDGKFEIIIIRRLSLIEIVKMFFKRATYNTDKVETLVAEKVQISTDKSVYFQVDGEYFGKRHTIMAEIGKGALRIILPEELP